MTGARFYRIGAVLLTLGLLAIVFAPEPMLVGLSIAVPIALVAGIVSTSYLARVLVRQPVPRSRFFRMLVESFAGLMAVGVWVGYLSFARVLERARLDGAELPEIPVPPTTVTSPITALLVVLVFTIPVRFALEVYRLRRFRGDVDEREDPIRTDVDLLEGVSSAPTSEE